MISFNCSVSGDKTFLKEYNDSIQIMPSQKNYLSLKFINSFPEITEKRIACIHTSYITRIFSEKFFEKNSFQENNIKSYISLAKRIGFKYVLIHGPESFKEWRYIDSACKKLKNIINFPDNILTNEKKPEVDIIIEMPSFKSDFIEQLIKECNSIYDKSNTGKINYIYYYFDKIINYFDIVIDTAHLYANGCNVDDMINIYETYKNNMKISHLNGNKNSQFHSDAHCPIFSPKNHIENINKLISYLSTTNLILITENTSDGVDYKTWEIFAKNNNLKIVNEHDNLNT